MRTRTAPPCTRRAAEADQVALEDAFHELIAATTPGQAWYTDQEAYARYVMARKALRLAVMGGRR